MRTIWTTALLAWATVAPAATITVNGTADALADDATCTLREAVRAANQNTAVGGCTAGSGSGTDVIVLPAGDYVLSITGTDEDAAATGDLDLAQSVTISGAGASTTTIDADGLDRAFDVLSVGIGAFFEGVTIQGGVAPGGFGGGVKTVGGDVTFTDCVLSANSAASGGGFAIAGAGSGTFVRTSVLGNTSTSDGAGIFTSGGDLDVTDSTIGGNVSNDSGGGIMAGASGGSATVTIVRSSIESNSAANNGAGYMGANNVTLDVRNSTFSGNTAGSSGGALSGSFTGGAVLNNVTISGNTASDGGGIYWNASGVWTLSNSILAGNTALNEPPDGTDCYGSLTSGGYNVIGTTAGCTLPTTTGDQTPIIAPGVEALADNGGPTWTRALTTDSPALDAGNPGPSGTRCEDVDQRGVARPQGAGCDAGAFELEPTTTTTVPASTTTTTTLLPTTCTSGITIAKPKVTLGKLGGTAGDETVTLAGTLQFPAGVPPAFAPATDGLQLLVTTTADAPIWTLSAQTAPVPGGAPGAGCGAKDGWKGLVYKNTSGALDVPTCTAGSAQGLSRVKLVDKRAKGKGVKLSAKAKGATIATTAGPVRLTVVTSAAADAIASGACATAELACTTKGAKLRCK